MSDTYIDIVFYGPPAHESGHFIEVENPEGASICVGEWVEREDGYWVLRIPSRAAILEEAAATIPASEKPENPYDYEPDVFDNRDDILEVGINRGWAMGAWQARQDAARTISALAVEEHE